MRIARDAILQISTYFPWLKLEENEGDPVELSVTAPIQDGIHQKIWLALQNDDELSFGVGNFQVEWFPCTDPDNASEFVKAVCGYIDGKYRIWEHYRGHRCIKAELQSPEEAGWKTVATWSLLWWPFPLKKSFREVRNA